MSILSPPWFNRHQSLGLFQGHQPQAGLCPNSEWPRKIQVVVVMTRESKKTKPCDSTMNDNQSKSAKHQTLVHFKIRFKVLPVWWPSPCPASWRVDSAWATTRAGSPCAGRRRMTSAPIPEDTSHHRGWTGRVWTLVPLDFCQIPADPVGRVPIVTLCWLIFQLM